MFQLVSDRKKKFKPKLNFCLFFSFGRERKQNSQNLKLLMNTGYTNILLIIYICVYTHTYKRTYTYVYANDLKISKIITFIGCIFLIVL